MLYLFCFHPVLSYPSVPYRAKRLRASQFQHVDGLAWLSLYHIRYRINLRCKYPLSVQPRTVSERRHRLFQITYCYYMDTSFVVYFM